MFSVWKGVNVYMFICLISGFTKKNETRFNQMIVAIVDVLTSFDVISNDDR